MRDQLSLAACATALVTHAATAQTTLPCAGMIDVTMISEPWETYSRSYAEGAIRVFEAHVAPTMAAGAVIGALHPVPGDPHPMRACTAVVHSDPDQPHFSEAVMCEATAAYDPARGLNLRFPVRFPDFRQPIAAVEVTINQATGRVSAR